MYFSALMEMQADGILTEKIKKFKGMAFAGNQNTEVFGELVNVSGFKFLTITLMGCPKVKTFKGCKVGFKGESFKLELESDTLEIDTDYSNKLRMGITSFDIDLEPELENAIRQHQVQILEVTFGREFFVYNIHQPEMLIKIIKGEKNTKDYSNPLSPE